MKTQPSFEKVVSEIHHLLDTYMNEMRCTVLKQIIQSMDVPLLKKASKPREEKPKKTPVMRIKGEVQKIKNQILEILQTHPGISAAKIAQDLKLINSDIQYPLRSLLEDDKIRSVGEMRSRTYFPTCFDAATQEVNM